MPKGDTTVIPFRRPVAAVSKLYEAKGFSAQTEFGEFLASGTLCGHIDFATPKSGTFTFSPDEVVAIIAMLQGARTDVLNNSEPLTDPRLVDK